MSDFRNVTLKCLSEIGALNVGPEYNGKFVTLFQVVMTSINRIVPPSTGESNLEVERSRSDEAEYWQIWLPPTPHPTTKISS